MIAKIIDFLVVQTMKEDVPRFAYFCSILEIVAATILFFIGLAATAPETVFMIPYIGYCVYQLHKAKKKFKPKEQRNGISASKQCPCCAEKVKLRARNCRFCGHEFERLEYPLIPGPLASDTRCPTCESPYFHVVGKGEYQCDMCPNLFRVFQK